MKEGKLTAGKLLPDRSSFLTPEETANFESSPVFDVDTGETTTMQSYTIPELQPRQAWRLAFSGDGWSKPSLHIRAKATSTREGPPPSASPSPSAVSATVLVSAADKEKPVISAWLLEEGFTTWLVDHGLGILYFLAFLFFLLCAAVVFAWSRAN